MSMIVPSAVDFESFSLNLNEKKFCLVIKLILWLSCVWTIICYIQFLELQFMALKSNFSAKIM